MRESCRISFSVSFATPGRIVCGQPMDVLRNLFGNLSAGIIRLLVTVGILAAVYFFIVRPALDTTEKISHEVNVNVEKGFEQTNLGNIDKTINNVNRKVQREIKRSLRQSKHHGAANQLLDCIQRAHQDVHKIQHCTEKY
jgi:predicted PurR-regulated permease PerM